MILIAGDPDMRLRRIAATLGVSERNAQSIVTDLVDGGYVLKSRDGRRNRYQIQAEVPLGEDIGRKRPIGDVLGLLVEADTTVVLEIEVTKTTTTQSPSSARLGRGNTSTASKGLIGWPVAAPPTRRRSTASSRRNNVEPTPDLGPVRAARLWRPPATGGASARADRLDPKR